MNPGLFSHEQNMHEKDAVPPDHGVQQFQAVFGFVPHILL
jgi:hypothetical protein